VSSAGRQDTYEKIIVRIAIRGQDKITHTTTAMIDCGATENFIDREYARQNQIPLLRKAVPRHCLAVDGTEVLGGPITHEALLDVTINNHEETVRLQCITIGNSSVILGLPWLRKHNPAIDGRENRVSFNSEYCAKKCLDTSPHAVTVPEDKATQEYFKKTPLDGEPPEEVLSISMVDAETFSIESDDGTAGTITLKDINEILEAWELYHVIVADPVQKETLKKEATLKETIPKEYHEYLHLFDQKDPTELPPHRNHDHHIPLVDGKTSPFEAIRALDEKKLRALKEYIETNLKIGRIQPSKSPAGAPIHFALKKDGSLRLCVDY
jgi:RNase H-fold protein (predicted Holliday junction resolvase)